MLAIIQALELAYGVLTATTLLVKAVLKVLGSPEGKAVAEAATRVVGDAEKMFAHGANKEKRDYALVTVMGDTGANENAARLAIEAAVIAKTKPA